MVLPKRKAPGRMKLRAPERQTRLYAIADLREKRKCERLYPRFSRNHASAAAEKQSARPHEAPGARKAD